MAQQFTDIMVDVETTGTRPDRNAMIQLSAVRFNLATHDVDPSFFNRCLAIPAWRQWDLNCLEWWQNDKNEILSGIYGRMEDPAVVMRDFVDWAAPANIYRFWSKPSHFDFMFLSSYCDDFKQPMPFDFRQANDMRSFMRGRAWPEPAVEPQLDFRGEAHNAIYDVLHQIRILFEFVGRPE